MMKNESGDREEVDISDNVFSALQGFQTSNKKRMTPNQLSMLLHGGRSKASNKYEHVKGFGILGHLTRKDCDIVVQACIDNQLLNCEVCETGFHLEATDEHDSKMMTAEYVTITDKGKKNDGRSPILIWKKTPRRKQRYESENDVQVQRTPKKAYKESSLVQGDVTKYMSQEGGTRSHSDETEFYGWCGVEDGNRSTNSDKGGWTFFRDQDFSGESDEDGSLEEEKVWEAPKKPRKLKSLAKYEK